ENGKRKKGKREKKGESGKKKGRKGRRARRHCTLPACRCRSMEPPPLSREPESVETEKSVFKRGVATIVEDSITAAEGPDRQLVVAVTPPITAATKELEEKERVRAERETR
ncbi:hypothetical protein HN51_012302, partial [Arachis hypogaea]